MTDTRTASLSYMESYVQRMTPVHIPEVGGGFVEYLDEGKTLGLATDQTAERIRAFVSSNSPLHPIVRAEFFLSGTGLERRGVILFDSRGTPVLHVQHALLGQRRLGLDVSQAVLQALGVREDLEAINAAIGPTYTVVFSREKTIIESDVEVAAPNQPPLDAWMWWQA